MKAICPRRMEKKEDPESKDTGSSSHFLLKVCVCVCVCVCVGEKENRLEQESNISKSIPVSDPLNE